jgi:hypothetical protein
MSKVPVLSILRPVVLVSIAQVPRPMSQVLNVTQATKLETRFPPPPSGLRRTGATMFLGL